MRLMQSEPDKDHRDGMSRQRHNEVMASMAAPMQNPTAAEVADLLIRQKSSSRAAQRLEEEIEKELSEGPRNSQEFVAA